MEEFFLKQFVGKKKVAIWIVGISEAWIGEVVSLQNGIMKVGANYLDCEMIVAIGEVV